MSRLLMFFAAVAAAAFPMASAQGSGVAAKPKSAGPVMEALPEDETLPSWTVQTCPAIGPCEVVVTVGAPTADQCGVKTDKHIVLLRRRFSTQLRWKLDTSGVPAGIEFRFGHTDAGGASVAPGIEVFDNVREGALRDFGPDPQQADGPLIVARKARGLLGRVQQRLYVYDINVEWRPATGGPWTNCKPFGPIIANRE